jgi:hypothetical protein
MGVKIHGIELVGESTIINTKVESLASDPTFTDVGRIWHNSTDDGYTYSLRDSGDSLISRSLVNKTTVDTEFNKRPSKEAVSCATTEACTVAAFPDTIDGYTLITGDRVLVKDATNAAENGIYVVSSVGGGFASITRSLDCDGTPEGEVYKGIYVFATQGTVNAGKGFRLATSDPITIDTTELSWVQFTAAGNITAGFGIAEDTTNVFSFDVDDTTLLTTSAGVKLADGLIRRNLVELDDVPGTYGTEGQVLRVNATQDALEWGNLPENILDLIDTPSTFGTAGQSLVVNATQDGLEWGDPYASIQAEIDDTETGSGLQSDGTLGSLLVGGTYIAADTSLKGAMLTLDTKLANLVTNYNATLYKETTTVPALTHTITHNLNTLYPEVTVWVYDTNTSTWNVDVEDVKITDANTIDISLAVSENVRVVVTNPVIAAL